MPKQRTRNHRNKWSLKQQHDWLKVQCPIPYQWISKCKVAWAWLCPFICSWNLRTLLNCLFVGKETNRKVAAIGQAIVQAVRPRAVVAPLQLGLAVQVHHLYRSWFLVDTLHGMGFSTSYNEVLRFENNAASIAPDKLADDIDLLDIALLFADDNSWPQNSYHWWQGDPPRNGYCSSTDTRAKEGLCHSKETNY